MKVMFVVQGEGRGHLTQALTLEKMLRNRGHEVVEVLVGRSKAREIPSFFAERIHAPVRGFESPNFLPSKTNQRVGLVRSIAYNVAKSPQYMASIYFLQHRMEMSGADVVVNFYEVLTGLAYYLFSPDVPMVCIGHQYLFLHPEYEFPAGRAVSRKLLLAFTKATCLGARRLFALSFGRKDDCDAERISVVPPLLRREVMDMPRHHGDYVTGYILNAGFSDSVMQWHRRHPEVKMHFFWDKKGADEVTKVDDTLTFHRISDHKFLHYLADCKAYATTGGFESVCEAMYMGKPVMMVPAHVEQECNAHEAQRHGAGVRAESFDIDRLLAFSHAYDEDVEFRIWENKAEWMIVSRLEGVVEQYQNEQLTGTCSIEKTFSAG